MLLLKKLNKDSIVRHFSTYFSSAIFGASISFLVLPAITRLLGPENYALVELFITIKFLLVGIVLFGTSSFLQKKFYSLDESDRKRLFSSIINVIIMSYFVVLSIIFLLNFFGFSFQKSLSIPDEIIFLALSTTFFEAFSSIYLSLLQINKESLKYSIIVNLKVIIEWVVVFVVLLNLSSGWEGRVYPSIIVSIIMFIFVLIMQIKNGIKFIIDLKIIKKIIKFGFPLIFASLSGWIMEMIDKLVINKISGLADTGLYSLGYKIGMIIMIIAIAFSKAWAPFFYENIDKNKSKIVKYTYLYISVLLLICIIISLLSEVIITLLFSSDFSSSAKIIPIIAFAYFFDGLWKMFILYLININRTVIYTVLIFIASAINLVLNIVLVPIMGEVGAAYATLISFIVGAVATFIVSTNYVKMPWFTFYRSCEVE